MNKITLQNIRDAKTFDELKPAIRFLCDYMQKMTWGEYMAFERTIEKQAKKLGVTFKEVNVYAENYQVMGEL